jgi:PAS domain S-box-containing protein/putative nucleotidyltransferase with HDIG domain
MAKVLIVDDERSIRETLAEFVKELDHEAFIAGDADEALGVVAASDPDVVVCDIVLPGVDGIGVLERVHRTHPDTQVIVITGEPTVETASDAVRQGAFDYLSKPVSRADIQAVVESALRVRRIATERRRLAEENARYREHLEEEVEQKARELAESEAKYRALVETANEVVFVAQDGALKFVNPKALDVTGYTETELLSMPFPKLIHPEDREMVIDRHRRRLEGGDVPSEYAFRIVDAAGETKWIEIRPVMIEWEGRPASLNLAADITERMKADLVRRESEARYRALFEESPISLWQEDYSETKRLLDGLREEGVEDLAAHLLAHPEIVDECIAKIRVTDVNEATIKLHAAKSKEELLGHLGSVIPPDARPDFVTQLVAIADGETSYEGIGTDRRLDGTVMQVAVRWIVPPGFEDSLTRVFVSKIDITAIVEAEAALQEALSGTVDAIGLTTEMRDPYTAGHQRRVTALALAIAEEMSLGVDTIDAIRAAGLMHDIGKMAIPAEILSKPSALNDVEMSLIREHPRIAYNILRQVSFPWPVAEIVLQHHERIDGSGYPNGLSGDDVRLEARILAVADTVEAMASHRPYRAALGIDAALDEVETHRGSSYAPDVVDACLRVFREKGFEFPEGTAPIA